MDEAGPSREKVSGSEFAEKAGVSKQNVAYYYKAWQLAADDGHCPHAENLSPEDDEALDHLDEQDEEVREQWLVYYRKARKSSDPTQPSQPRGTGSKDSGVQDTKVTRAVEALAKTSEQLSDKLVKVLNATPLSGEDAELAEFAEELRRTRFVLDGYCREIDLILKRIGFGEAEPPSEDVG